MKLNILFVLAAFSFLLPTACGGLSRTTIVEQRPETGDLIVPLHKAAKADGLPSKSDESKTVKFYLDRTTGTRMYFNVKRKGLVMTIRVDAEKFPDKASQDAEFARAEVIGKRLLASARQRLLVVREAKVRAEEARRRQETAAAATAPQPAFQKPAFRNPVMDRMKSRTALKPRTNGFSTKKAGQPAKKKANSCCINKKYFSCPDLAAVDRCAGKYMRCLQGCGMTMKCMSSCGKTAPMDPSRCSRQSNNDSKCSR